MKRKMKAVAALSLAAVMLLAGCGSSKGTQDGGSAAEQTQQQTQLSSRQVQKLQHPIQERR